MKNYYYLILFICLFGNSLYAQIELKGNLYGFFYDMPYLSAEFFLGNKFGLELGSGLQFKNSSDFNYDKKTKFFITAKHYLFNHSKYKYDNTFLGLYSIVNMKYQIQSNLFATSNRQSSVVLGGMIGRKWMYTNHIFMEANLGLGLEKIIQVYEPNELIASSYPPSKPIKTDISLSFLIGYRF